MKKTIIISLLLHGCLCAAAFLWSATLTGAGGRVPFEPVMTVSLAEEKNSPHNSKSGAPDVKTKKDKVPERKETSTRAFVVKAPVSDIRSVTPIPETAESITDLPAPGDQAPASAPLPEEAWSTETERVLSTRSETVESRTGGEVVRDEKYAETPVVASLPGTEAGSETEAAGRTDETVLAIREAIERVKTYPLMARKRGNEGTVFISFRITPRGIPEDIRVTKSSGYRILDEATLDIVKRAAPFPYLDASLEVPVVFRLK